MANIKRVYQIASEEATIESHGHSFLCIYGSHINGNFISIQNWGVSAELSDANDVSYNSDAILSALRKEKVLPNSWRDIARDIATVIAPRLQELEKQQSQQNDIVCTNEKGQSAAKSKFNDYFR